VRDGWGEVVAATTRDRLAAFTPEGMRRGAGRVGPFSLVDMDAAFAAPHRRKGLSAAIPQIASGARGVTNIFAS
jgi:hypothetical protein